MNENMQSLQDKIDDTLLFERKIFLIGEVNDESAAKIVKELLYLEALDGEKDITLYINSPGGSVSAGFSIYDTMCRISCDVSTVCAGLAASMGAFLLAGGTKGKRFATPNSEIMIHQVLSGKEGQATDIEIATRQTLRVKDRLNAILAANTGHTMAEIEKDTDRDNWMFPEEAVAYGVIDRVL